MTKRTSAAPSKKDQLELAVIECLDELKHPTARDAFIAQSKDPKYYGMDFSERLSLILQAEVTKRKERRTERLLKESKIDDKTVSVQNIVYSEERNANAAVIKELAKGRWLENPGKDWIIVTGKTGTGKTFISKCLLKQAIDNGHRGCYIRANHLFDDLALAREEHKITKFKESLNRYQVLLIDDFNFQCITETVLEDFLDLLDDRYKKAFLIITSQFPLEEWYGYLQNNPSIMNKTRADAIMDRIINNSQTVELKGPSMREARRKPTTP